MTPEYVIQIARQALETVLLCSMPMLVTALLVGFLISVFQAATQINEQTMTFIPKIVAVFVALLLFGAWIMNIMLTFTTGIFKAIATIGG